MMNLKQQKLARKVCLQRWLRPAMMCSILLVAAMLRATAAQPRDTLWCVSAPDNDLVELLGSEGYRVVRCGNNLTALFLAPEGAPVLLLGTDAQKPSQLAENELELITRKRLRVFADFAWTGAEEPQLRKVVNERVVVPKTFGSLSPMQLLSINQANFFEAKSHNPSLVLARVVGFDNAVFGLTDTEIFPLVDSPAPGVTLSTARLSEFSKLRLMPERHWQSFWENMLTNLTGQEVKFGSWPSQAWPAYSQDAQLPDSARIHAVRKGVEWFWKGHFLVHPSWRAAYLEKYQNIWLPQGPALPADAPDGDGSMGILEGHYSAIDAKGKQDYRYWLRTDVHGEAAMALTLASKLLRNDTYTQTARRLVDFSLNAASQGPRKDPKSPVYGLLSWGLYDVTLDVYYGDDNARYLLGALLAAHLMGEKGWDERFRLAIDANLETTGLDGFHGDRLEGRDIEKNGRDFYRNRHFVNPHPHYESWMWAVYLWQYSLTGEKKYLETSKKGIKATMEAYPDEWKWTNGIQQERARMVLPLAWLYRVEPTEEHRQWLDLMVGELRKNQMPCGAIREELGDPSKGDFGGPTRNSQYGRGEAPLIFRNGDPVADMLYTSNFAFFGLNEAARATGDAEIQKMTDRLADFLVRIQVCSQNQPDVDGAWYRAFNYRDWNWWASNSDAGWGALSTLTGWIQSWIVSTLAMREMNTSYWELTH